MLVNFNSYKIYISSKSFKQNDKIAKELRLDVNLEINNKNLIAIGGESYIFGLINNIILNIIFYTNSKFIYNDAILNNTMYNKNLQNNLIDYNTINDIKSGNILIINLAKLHINLLNIINKRIYTKIIIINCHHKEFWNRIKILYNYKLIKRKQYITNNNFITVNILQYKYDIPIFIPIGNNCSIAYQLNNLNLRFNSYPFDWAKCNISQINKVLENKFKDFSKLKISKFSLNHLDIIDNKFGSYILKNKYNINFAHELLKEDNIINLENKFNKRINKLLKCKNKYIIFILLNLQNNIDNQINKLIINLKKYFTNFKILYISNYKIQDNKNIHSYIINTTWSGWEFNHLNWEKIIINNILKSKK